MDHVVHYALEHFDLFIRRSLDQEADGISFEGGAHSINFRDIAIGEIDYRGAAPRLGHDEAIPLQDMDGLSHRIPADAHLAREFLFEKALARPELAGKNERAQSMPDA